MSAQTTRIRRSDKATRALGFERLLEQGLQQLRRASGELWTDHNLHDPGITTLEQLCFALTELGYRADLPIADQLAGPDGSIDCAALALHPPEQALPCRATTVGDYRRLLLDLLPDLDDAHLQPATGEADAGLYRLKLKVAGGTPFSPADQDAAAKAAASRDEALRIYRAERNLCEDLVEVGIVQGRRCDLHGDIEIAGMRDVAEIVADLYHRAARWIDRGPRVFSRPEMLASGLAMDRVYDGPVARVGFVQDEPREECSEATLYLSDLARVLRGVEGVKEVHDLALATWPGAAGRGSVPWGGVGWALRLHIPLSPGEFHVRLRRRALDVALPDADEIWRRVRNLRLADLTRRTRLASSLRKEEQQARPRGRHRPPAAHLSVQHDFPAVYTLGRHALAASASAQQKARVHQLRAYLLMFDQLLANGAAQLDHLRELYAVRGQGPAEASLNRRSYWWQAPDAQAVPGLEELLTQSPDQLAEEGRAFFDRSSARKSRLLDHLLALHGETLTQNALRQHCEHLRADELDRRLLDNKARYLEAVVELGRGRAGSFDYSQPLWGNPANFSGLARRVGLLLGFKHDEARRLTRLPEAAMLPVLVAGEREPELDEAPASAGEQINVVDAPEEPANLDSVLLLLQQRPRLLAPMLRAGTRHDAYRLRGTPTESVITVGPDEQGRTWRLGRASTRALARAWARQFRRAFVDINDRCEGLHLVEHVLLRPLEPDSAAHAQLDLGPDFYALRLSVVMPDWTVRTHQPVFRALAEETLRLNLPVHLIAQPIVWLDYERMQHFEDDLARWLALRVQWCKAPEAPHAKNVDVAACQVIRWLREPAGASPKGAG